MPESHVRLRGDLEIRSEGPEENSPVILKDPITRRFYRFTAVQAGVLRRFTGTRDFASIAAEVAREFRTQVTEQQVADFVARLRSLLLLDEEDCWRRLESGRKRRHRILNSILAVKIHAFNPDALLARLERRLRFCFGTPFTVAAWAAIAAALVISIVNWDSLYVSLGTLFALHSVPLILVVASIVMTIHEFAHGIALKHYGGKTEEMGFLLLYFIPAFYCNVSDAWMLRRRQRFMVTLAGGYAQLLIWAAATLAWRFLAQETFASRVCLVAIAFSGIQALFNFNPLIRLDGYYLLSDFLGVPNLRPKSFRYLRQRLGSWLYGVAFPGPQASGREKTIYWIYGMSAFVFSAALIWVTLDRVGGWMLREYKTWGLLLVAGIILLALPAPVRSVPPAPEKDPEKSLLRMRKFWRLAALAAVLGGIALLPWELKVSGDFVINAERRVAVSARVDGTLKTIVVDEGTRVRQGDVLAELQNLELSNNYEETRGELASRRASLQLLLAGTRPEEIDRARRLVDTKRAEMSNTLRVDQERRMLLETVAKKRAELDQAQTNYERSERLLKDGLIARNELERDRTTYEVQRKELSEAEAQLRVLEERTDRTWQVKRKELDQAQSELKILEAGSRKEAIAAMEAEVSKLETKEGILGQQLELLKIRSDIDGVVATPYLPNRVGEWLGKGDSLCDIVSLGVVKIDMPVPEKEIADVQPGFRITMKVRGYPKRAFEARVKTISPVALDSGSERKVIVQGELENADGTLKAGMTGVGKILCGRRMIGELVTRRAVRWLRTEFWEYLP